MPSRPHVHERHRNVEACPFVPLSTAQLLDLNSHEYLHSDGRHLIASWFDRAWQTRDDVDSIFESFVFSWIAVNAWAACVTGEDRDREYMKALTNDPGLRAKFHTHLQNDPVFRGEAEAFFALLPIFKAQQLRRNGIHLDERVPRVQRIQHYFDVGLTEFEPRCARFHFERGESIPRDWPHFIEAVYRVRCNLFHGEKSGHSEMDRDIVRAALLSLTSFFRGAHIL